MSDKYELPPVVMTRPELLEKAQDSAEVQAVEAAMVNVVKCPPYRHKRRTHVAVQAMGPVCGDWAARASKGHDKKGRGHM